MIAGNHAVRIYKASEAGIPTSLFKGLYRMATGSKKDGRYNDKLEIDQVLYIHRRRF